MKYIKLKTLLLTLSAISLAFAPLIAIPDDAGTTGFSLLKNVYSARAVAMGQSFTGVGQNPDGLHFNPAGIIRIDGKEIGTTYSNYFIDAQGGQLQYLAPRNKYTAWGFALKYMNMGSMDRTTIDNYGDIVETGETFGAYNLIGSASLAKYISPIIDMGGTVKVVYDQIDDVSAAAVALDLGLIHHPENQKVKVGISIRNLGSQVKYYTDSKYKENLPLTVAAGISYKFRPNFFGSFDINKASGENIVGKLGVEYSLNPALNLRMGLRTDAGDQRLGGGWGWSSGLSTGAGWKWRSYRVDYALSSYGDLGFIHQLSLIHEF